MHIPPKEIPQKGKNQWNEKHQTQQRKTKEKHMLETKAETAAIAAALIRSSSNHSKMFQY